MPTMSRLMWAQSSLAWHPTTGSSANPLGSVAVSFQPDAHNSLLERPSGQYAPPYLSNNSGLLFDGQANGADATQYITSGKDGSSNPRAAATITFSGLQDYFGLLWGSVDLYNTLDFYNGNTLVGTITGGQINPTATGDQGVNGTYYVNITSTLGFNKVVARSSEYAFEFDNIAYQRFVIPEPGTILIWSAFAGLGLLALAADEPVSRNLFKFY